MQPPYLEAFLHQQAPQHAAAREREFHIRLVDPVHQLRIGVRHRAGLVTHAAAADPQHDRLAADAQLGGGIDLFCARQQTRLAERAGQKIVLQRQLSDLRMQGLHVDHRFRRGLHTVLVLQSPQPLRNRRLHAPIFRFVFVERRRADPEPPT